MPPKSYLYFPQYDGDLRTMTACLEGVEQARVKTINVHTLNPEAGRREIATASADNTARIWPVSTEDLIREACRRVAKNPTAAEWDDILPESYFY